MQESMVFYKSFFDAINNIEDAKIREQVYSAIFQYSLLEKEPELEGLALTLFILIKPQLAANLKRREDGKHGGRPKKTIGFENKNHRLLKSDANKKPNVNVNVNENVNVNVNDIDIESVRELFNSNCIFMKPCQAITKKRAELIKELLEAYSIEEIKNTFEKANKTDWLIGKNEKGWKATFDWLIDIDHFTRVMEGAYESIGKEKNQFKDYKQSEYDWDEINRELGIKT